MDSESRHSGQILGTLEVGKIAGVLVAKGEPLWNILALSNTHMVIHNGALIHSAN